MGSCARGRRWARLVGPPYNGPSRCQEPGLEASAPRSLRAGRQVGFCGRGRGAKPGETQVLPSPDPGSCPHSWDRRGGGWTPLHAVLSPRRPPMEPPRLTQVTKRVSEAGRQGRASGGLGWSWVRVGALGSQPLVCTASAPCSQGPPSWSHRPHLARPPPPRRQPLLSPRQLLRTCSGNLSGCDPGCDPSWSPGRHPPPCPPCRVLVAPGSGWRPRDNSLAFLGGE